MVKVNYALTEIVEKKLGKVNYRRVSLSDAIEITNEWAKTVSKEELQKVKDRDEKRKKVANKDAIEWLLLESGRSLQGLVTYSKLSSSWFKSVLKGLGKKVEDSDKVIAIDLDEITLLQAITLTNLAMTVESGNKLNGPYDREKNLRYGAYSFIKNHIKLEDVDEMMAIIDDQIEVLQQEEK